MSPALPGHRYSPSGTLTWRGPLVPRKLQGHCGELLRIVAGTHRACQGEATPLRAVLQALSHRATGHGRPAGDGTDRTSKQMPADHPQPGAMLPRRHILGSRSGQIPGRLVQPPIKPVARDSPGLQVRAVSSRATSWRCAPHCGSTPGGRIRTSWRARGLSGSAWTERRDSLGRFGGRLNGPRLLFCRTKMNGTSWACHSPPPIPGCIDVPFSVRQWLCPPAETISRSAPLRGQPQAYQRLGQTAASACSATTLPGADPDGRGHSPMPVTSSETGRRAAPYAAPIHATLQNKRWGANLAHTSGTFAFKRPEHPSGSGSVSPAFSAKPSPGGAPT